VVGVITESYRRHRACGVLELLGVAESLVEQVAQLPWPATVRGLSGLAGRCGAPAGARYPQVPSLLGRLLILGRPTRRPAADTTSSSILSM
jgi:hypothetical protein